MTEQNTHKLFLDSLSKLKLSIQEHVMENCSFDLEEIGL